MAGNNYLPTEYQTFIHASRYARWLPDEGRRETWIETVSRFSNFMQGHLDKNLGVVLPSEVWRRIEDNIIGLSVMPSMRALMTAGAALEREKARNAENRNSTVVSSKLSEIEGKVKNLINLIDELEK